MDLKHSLALLFNKYHKRQYIDKMLGIFVLLVGIVLIGHYYNNQHRTLFCASLYDQFSIDGKNNHSYTEFEPWCKTNYKILQEAVLRGVSNSILLNHLEQNFSYFPYLKKIPLGKEFFGGGVLYLFQHQDGDIKSTKSISGDIQLLELSQQSKRIDCPQELIATYNTKDNSIWLKPLSKEGGGIPCFLPITLQQNR